LPIVLLVLCIVLFNWIGNLCDTHVCFMQTFDTTRQSWQNYLIHFMTVRIFNWSEHSEHLVKLRQFFHSRPLGSTTVASLSAASGLLASFSGIKFMQTVLSRCCR
jgi:hypothetical protein